ncbi:MAG: CinA family protein, partial [Planctomycetales bacterium]|nr:CinA family protein [Planctomycetales bacterium]
ADRLRARDVRIVFAESCTAGLASAALAGVPGVSAWHCGSAVTYREATKTAWLGVSAATIAERNVVSREVAQEMAAGVLRITPDATLAVAVTGHLGPDAPAELDGLVHLAAARRTPGDVAPLDTLAQRLAAHSRIDRQHEAAAIVLEFAASCVERNSK